MTAIQRICCCNAAPIGCAGCDLCSSSYAMDMDATGTWTEGSIVYSFVLSASGTVTRSTCSFSGSLTGSLVVTGSGVYAGTYSLPASQTANNYACITDPENPQNEINRFEYAIRINPGFGGVFIRTMSYNANISPAPCPPDGEAAVNSAVTMNVSAGGIPRPSTLSTFAVNYT